MVEQERLEAVTERTVGILDALLGYLQEKKLIDDNEFINYCSLMDYENIQKECKRDEQAARSEQDDLHAGGSHATIALCEQAQIDSGDYVLDAGTGHGGAARIIAETFGCRVLGIEMDYPRLVSAVFRSKQEGNHSNLEYLHADAYHMPFQESSFSAIVRQHAIYGQEERLFLSECFRILVPGGRIAFQGVLRMMPGNGPKTGMDQFTLDEYRNLLTETGFTRLNCETVEATKELMDSYINRDPVRYLLVKKGLLIGIRLTAYKEQEG